jgi:hypothetical protein
MKSPKSTIFRSLVLTPPGVTYIAKAAVLLAKLTLILARRPAGQKPYYAVNLGRMVIETVCETPQLEVPRPAGWPPIGGPLAVPIEGFCGGARTVNVESLAARVDGNMMVHSFGRIRKPAWYTGSLNTTRLPRKQFLHHILARSGLEVLGKCEDLDGNRDELCTGLHSEAFDNHKRFGWHL